MKATQKILNWALTILLTLFFLVAGTEKWREAFHIVANYEAMGISLGFMKMIGTLEILSAIGLLFKPYARHAAFGLAMISTFTLIACALFQIWDAAIVAVISLGLSLLLAHLRK